MEEKKVYERTISFSDWKIKYDVRTKDIYTLENGEGTFTIEGNKSSDRYVIFEEDFKNDGIGKLVGWAYGLEDLATEIDSIFNMGFSHIDSLERILDAASNTFYFLHTAMKMIENRFYCALER